MISSMTTLHAQPGSTPAPAVVPARMPLWDMGFRPFFLGAIVYAAIAMAIWCGAFALGIALPGVQHYGSLWHAHEMIFGYSAAVIAGFLLTAVRNWTGLPTLERGPLAVLFALWVAARLAFCVEPLSLLAAAFDGVFNLLLMPAQYFALVVAAQLLWIASFTALAWLLVPMLIGPRAASG